MGKQDSNRLPHNYQLFGKTQGREQLAELLKAFRAAVRQESSIGEYQT